MPTGVYPRTKEWKEANKASLSRPHLKGLPRTNEWKKNIGEGNKRGKMVPCTECGKEVYRHKYRLEAKACYCSLACQSENKKKWMKGAQSPAWDGGVSSLNERIRAMDQNRSWKKDVLARDRFECKGCGAHGVQFHIHHKTPMAVMIREFLSKYNQFSPKEDIDTLVRLAINHAPFWDASNGVTLCLDCHREQPGHENLINALCQRAQQQGQA